MVIDSKLRSCSEYVRCMNVFNLCISELLTNKYKVFESQLHIKRDEA